MYYQKKRQRRIVMARAARQRRENELPYIPFGPFQIRFPFIHYKIESVEFIQGLILGVTALAAVPYLEQYLGLPYELAWSCVIIETMLYMLHSLLGDPVVPGWITADDRIPGRLPYGKRTYPGNDRPADAGWSRVHIYGHHQACG